MPARTTHSSRPTWLLPTVVMAVAAILIWLIIAMNGSEGTSADNDLQPPGQGATTESDDPAPSDFTDIERRDDNDLLAIGTVDAPVVLVVFSDYQCPFCAKWSTETMPQMMDHVEAGDLRIEWRDINVFGPASERASRASLAAAEQGAFWEYHDELFAGGDTRSEGDLSEEALVELAADLGLDTDQFATDLSSEDVAEQIVENEQLGLDLGAHSTPVFLLGGQPIVGAQPSLVFLEAFDDALDAAE